MDSFAHLQQWYLTHCDGEWEHGYGVRIATLDNPGWSLDINLIGTPLEDKIFRDVYYGLLEDAETSGNEWIICKVESGKFVARGGPLKLKEMIDVFIGWANGAA